MKISNERWDEWFAAPVTDSVSAESELAGIVSCLACHKENGIVRAGTSRLWVYRRFRRLWPYTAWSREMELADILHVRDRRVDIELRAALYHKILAKPKRSDFIRWAWVRGIFGCVGSIYNPRHGYYCIMRFHEPLVAGSVLSLLAGSEISASARIKDGVREVTIRDLQQITRFCYFMGLQQVAQSLEERSLLRSSRDLANKQANCDSANIRRSVETSRRHLDVIEFLRGRDPELIPEKLRQLVRVRLENPEATLSDLGDMLRPQVSKSTVKYRLNKLRQIAEAAGYEAPKNE